MLQGCAGAVARSPFTSVLNNARSWPEGLVHPFDIPESR